MRIDKTLRMSVTSRVRSKAAERLLNRELSWLEFNARVLALAADEGFRCSSV